MSKETDQTLEQALQQAQATSYQLIRAGEVIAAELQKSNQRINEIEALLHNKTPSETATPPNRKSRRANNAQNKKA